MRGLGAEMAQHVSSKTDAQRQSELAQLNGKLYTVAEGRIRQELPSCGGRAVIFGCAVVWTLSLSSDRCAVTRP